MSDREEEKDPLDHPTRSLPVPTSGGSYSHDPGTGQVTPIPQESEDGEEEQS